MTTPSSGSTGSSGSPEFPRADRASRCENCESAWYYTKPACPTCGSEAIEPYDLGVGVVEATTEVHATPEGVRSPNRLALARFDGVGVVAQVAGSVGALAAGDRVRFAGENTLRETDRGTVSGPRLTAVGTSANSE